MISKLNIQVRMLWCITITWFDDIKVKLNESAKWTERLWRTVFRGVLSHDRLVQVVKQHKDMVLYFRISQDKYFLLQTWNKFFFFFFFFFFVFLGPQPQRMEVPRLGVESELQLLTYTIATATQDRNQVCTLHSSQQCQIPNPLSEARDWTWVLMDTSWVCYCWAMMGTPNME